MAGKTPPPLFVQGATYKVGEMFGFGPTPGWQYLNAVKVGVERVYFGDPPTQYYEYDVIEYIHPAWDATLDYSKDKHPSRVWFNGMLYSPGRWLTTGKRGQNIVTTECGLGDPRFRPGMNNPALEDPESRVVNQSHPFRIWKPYSRFPEQPHVTQGPNSGITTSVSPDGPILEALPVTTAHENQHYDAPDSRTRRIFGPSLGQAYRYEIGPVPGQPSPTLRIKNYNYEDPHLTPVTVSDKTGKMTQENIICVNSESDFNQWPYGILYAGGISLSHCYTQSWGETITEVWVPIPNGNGARRKEVTITPYISSGSPDTKNHYISASHYDGGYGFYGMSPYLWTYNYILGTMAKESAYAADGSYKDELFSSSSGQTSGPNSYSSFQKSKSTIPLNLYVNSNASPFFYTRDVKVQQEILTYYEEDTYQFCCCTDAVYNYVDSGQVSGKDFVISPKPWGITVGGESPDTPPVGFKNNTYYNDAHSMGSSDEHQEEDITSQSTSYNPPSPACDYGNGKTTRRGLRRFGPRQWGWVQ